VPADRVDRDASGECNPALELLGFLVVEGLPEFFLNDGVSRLAYLVDVRTDDASMGHEATVSKISADQLFYLMSRGLTEDEAMAMIVRGFVEPIARELPMEYALELNRLIELQMEGAVG